MTPKKRALLFDIIGAAVSFACPAAAAVCMFPRTVENAGERVDFLGVLHLSAAAFAVLAILLALTLWRFFRDRVKIPKSGLAVSLVAFGVCYGIEQFIHALTVILFFAAAGAAVAEIFYLMADRIRRTAGAGEGKA